MKFIYIGDLHLSLYSNDKIDKDTGLPLRLSMIKTVLYNVANYALSFELYNIVIGGDIFHTKSVIHTLAQSVLLDFVRDFQKVEFIVIDGNHDLSSKSGSGVSALKCLDNEPNVQMLHETKKIENILFVPWGPNMVNDIKNGKADYLIAHIGLNEAQLSSGISIVSDIRLNDLKNYKRCFLSHYHRPQEVGNVTYVGSLIQLDWGEKHEDKRFLIVDTNTGKVDSELTYGYKKYFEFEITNENKVEIVKTAKSLQDEGNFVNIVKREDVDVDDIPPDLRVVDKTEVDVTDRGLSIRMSKEDILQRYLEIKKVPETEREKYYQVAIDIIESKKEIVI